MNQAYETILASTEDGITTVTFNRPQKKNAMNPKMHREMDQVLTLLARDPGCRVLVLTGAGDSWCAGEDLEEYFYNLADKPLERSDASTWSKWRGEKLRLLPKPTIASINGWCVGGAFTTLSSCDIAIAADEAKFCLSEINFGHFPGGEVTRAVSSILAPRDFLYLSLTGEIIDAKTAFAIGLVNHVVPANQLEAKTMDIANRIANKGPIALKLAKEAVKLASRSNLDEGLRREVDLFALCFSTEDKDEGVSAFLEKRKPAFKGR